MGHRFKSQLRKGLLQFVIDKVDFRCVPIVPRLGFALLQLGAGGEGHVSHIDAAVVLEQGQQLLKERLFLFIRQMMQRVGGNDGVIPLLFQFLDPPQGKVPPWYSCARGIFP